MSECDPECRLCGALGCLRPHRITMPEFLVELDRAAQRCASSVVFPPNFLNHPEAAQFCYEVARRGFSSLVRLRPSQLVAQSELLSTLEYRGARFEVVVAEAIPLTAISSRFDFRCVFVPSRLVDPVLLFDSVPFTWRKDLSVLAPLPSTFASALSCDELYLFTQSRPAPAYHGRAVHGTIPGSPESVLVPGSYPDKKVPGSKTAVLEPGTFLSVVVAANRETDIPALLAALAQQSYGSFEIIVVCDRVSDEVVESLSSLTSLQVVRLPECWGDVAFRQAEAFNLAALYARGTSILFLSEGFPLERELLNRCSTRTETFVRLDSRSNEKSARCAHLMTLQYFFSVGGYALTDHNGFEFASFERAAGTVAHWVLGDVDKAETPVPSLPPKRTKMHMLAARDFYHSTLDSDFYRANFSMMGGRVFLRRLISLFGRLGLAQPFNGIIARMRLRAEYAQAYSAYMRTVKS